MFNTHHLLHVHASLMVHIHYIYDDNHQNIDLTKVSIKVATKLSIKALVFIFMSLVAKVLAKLSSC